MHAGTFVCSAYTLSQVREACLTLTRFQPVPMQQTLLALEAGDPVLSKDFLEIKNQAELLHEELQHEFASFVHEMNYTPHCDSITWFNQTRIHIFPIEALKNRMGEAPICIIFDKIGKISFDDWQWCNHQIKDFGTITTLYIASQLAGVE